MIRNHLQKLSQSSFRRNFSKVSSTDYCVDLVRKHEHENFLCTLLLKKDVRKTAFAVRAFNIELSLIADKAKEKDLAAARMKFWEESLDKIYADEPPKHPVALELARAVKSHSLLKKQFTRILKARLNSIKSPVYLDLVQYEKYCEETVSPIFYLIIQAAGIKTVDVDHAASHLGKAQGLCNLIRSIPHHAARRRVLLPQDLLTKYDITEENVIRKTVLSNIKEVIFEIASQANSHLNKARSLKSDLPKTAMPIFLPAVPLAIFLNRLRDTDFDVYDEILQSRNFHLGASLYWRKLCSTF